MKQVCNGHFGDLSAAVACRTMNKVAANKAAGVVIENTNNRFGEPLTETNCCLRVRQYCS